MFTTFSYLKFQCQHMFTIDLLCTDQLPVFVYKCSNDQIVLRIISSLTGRTFIIHSKFIYFTLYKNSSSFGITVILHVVRNINCRLGRQGMKIEY